MIRVLSILAALSLLALPAQARDPWTTADTVRQGIYLGLLTVACGQSMAALDKPERNPLLSRYPDKEQYRAYCLFWAITPSIIAYDLPRPYRELFQYISIAAETLDVHNNAYHAGIGLNLSF